MPLNIENTLKNYKVSILGKNLPDQGSFTSPLYNKGWRYDLGGRLSKLAPRLEGSQPWRHNQDDWSRASWWWSNKWQGTYIYLTLPHSYLLNITCYRMKSQIYAVPPTPVQEYQEALILLWMIFLTETWTLKGYFYSLQSHCWGSWLHTPAGVSLAVRDTPTTSTQDPPQVQDTLADISLDVPPATPTRDLPPVQVSLHPYLSPHRGGLWESREWAGMILKSLQARGEGVSWSAYESSRWRLWWGSDGRSQHGCSIRWSRRRRSW